MSSSPDLKPDKHLPTVASMDGGVFREPSLCDQSPNAVIRQKIERLGSLATTSQTVAGSGERLHENITDAVDQINRLITVLATTARTLTKSDEFVTRASRRIAIDGERIEIMVRPNLELALDVTSQREAELHALMNEREALQQAIDLLESLGQLSAAHGATRTSKSQLPKELHTLLANDHIDYPLQDVLPMFRETLNEIDAKIADLKSKVETGYLRIDETVDAVTERSEAHIRHAQEAIEDTLAKAYEQMLAVGNLINAKSDPTDTVGTNARSFLHDASQESKDPGPPRLSALGSGVNLL